MMSCSSKISDRLKAVKRNVRNACARVGRDPGSVRIIIVTKTAAMEAAKEVVRLGYMELGENRVQHLKQVATEMEAFIAENKEDPKVPRELTWHMIGHLQRNKVKQALQISRIIHSVDTLRLAEEIDQVAAKMGVRPDVLLQVNCSDEPQKYGVPVGAATHLAEQITTMKHMRLVGLMTMAPLTLNKEIVRSSFVRARELFEEVKGEKLVGPEFCELSMGMSQDYEIAVEEGATLLRIGSAIFA